MATVTKNFRIKSGLIVEGTSGTINGQNILTETGGDQYILNLVGGATLVKSVDTNVFSVDVAGNLTVNPLTFDSYGSATAAQDAAAIDATNKANQALADAQSYSNSLASNYDSAGSASAAQAAAALDATAKADAAQLAAEGYADGLASNYDAAGSASAAQTAAQSYADGLAVNYDSAGSATTAENNAKFYADGLISDLGGSGTASVAGNIDILTGTGIQVNGGNNSVEIDRQTVDTWYDAAGSASAAQQAAQLYADDAVASLVGSAPAVLDTIQELATALENNPDIIADLENVAAGKQDTLTAGSNIDITGTTISVTGLDSADISDFTGAARAAILPGVGVNLNTATGYLDANLGTGLNTDVSNNIKIDRSVVDGWYDAAGSASAAQTAAQSYADGLAVNYDAAGSASAAQTAAQSYADGLAVNYDAAGSAADAQTNAENFASGLVGNLLDATTPFDSLNLNDVAKQVAARSTSLGSVPVTAYQFNKETFKSGKFLVKIDNGTHNELSEILVTLDSADNIAITEYAIVGTNGSRGTITADINNSHCRIIVTPVNDSTITVSGTIFNA